MTWYQDLEDSKAHDEAAIIVQEFAKHDIAIGGVATERGGVSFMYREGHLLARELYLEHIRELLGRRGRAVVIKRVIRDVVLLKVSFSDEGDGKTAKSSDSAPEGNNGKPGGNNKPSEGNDQIAKSHQPALLRFLGEIDAEFGPGIATPDHVVTTAVVPAGEPSGCPATEPQEVYDPEPRPPACRGNGGGRVRIYVADTGIVENTVSSCPWLAGVTGDNDLSVAADGTIQPYGGHGTFVAGVIRCMAPGAEIVVANVFNIAGSGLESDFVPKLNAGFGYGAEIFHVTVASPTRGNLPLMAFEAWMQDLRQHKGVVCVVPAGNNGSRLPCWPAAFPEMVSVGALGADWRSRAYFSNYGSSVDVYAPGQDLVNAFATGSFTCQVAPFAGQIRTFSGMAQWSGTSFSTPIVTGLIAARMARCGESGREAAAALLAMARAQRIPGVGPVLLPGCDEDGKGRGDDCGGHGRCGDCGSGCSGRGCGGSGRGCGGGRCDGCGRAAS
ncbi:MAG: S8/S53 family peptidase [Actinomycetota bacterium]|nr:S8/S53 family peptidase [Actinomycetota bacterium]